MELMDHPGDMPFGKYEEEAILSLMLDHPEFFSSISQHLSPKLFTRPEVQYVVAAVLNYYEDYSVFPTRALLHDIIAKKLTVDDPIADDVLKIIDRESDPREIPALKDKLLTWAKSSTLKVLYDPDTIKRFHNGDLQYIEDIFDQCNTIQDIGKEGFWFFDNIERLFIEEEVEHLTTGIAQLDNDLNEGGPSRKEMVVWMAPTGVGKSIMLANNAVANVLKGKNVLYVTLELSDLKSALRIMGAMTDLPINQRMNNKDQLMSYIRRIKSSDIGDLVIYEYPPDEITVDQLYGLISHLKKTRGWVPDVLIVDYLELMCSRRASDNADDYSKQKSVSTQLRGVAINENVLVFTATQTNRSGNDDTKLIDVTKMAESYGKSMPMDYLVSINQSKEEYEATPAQARLYVAKNRNGPKFNSITVHINYKTMALKEIN